MQVVDLATQLINPAREQLQRPLEPGDVVSTGTPSGVGAARTPKRWILPGETVTVEIAKLGTLSNPVIKEA